MVAISPRGGYAGVAGADLGNAPQGDVPFTSPFGLPVTRMRTWYAGGAVPGAATGVPGNPRFRASGNPAVWTDQTNQPAKLPYGGGGNSSYSQARVGNIGSGQTQTAPNIGNPNAMWPETSDQAYLSQFGYPRVLNQRQETAVRAPGDAPVGYSNDKLITYDRHGMMKVGYENSGRNSGVTDPPMDGPARPSLWLVQRTLSYQQGTDTTAATDDLTRDYTRNAQGMYIGEQGTGWSRVNGGVPGLYQEYGSYSGISPSSPGFDVTTGAGEGTHSPTPHGQPGDGPHDVWSGPPHGLHSPTLPTYSQTLGRYMSIPQMATPRIDRPSNSTIQGQSYSQTVQPQGQTGTRAQNTNINSGVAWNQRAAGNGWRGRGVQ